jgi:superfamily I DNA/RNA helicase
MTIHQAKGLEFPIVVLGAAMNGRLPATRRNNVYKVPDQFCASGDPEVEDPHMVTRENYSTSPLHGRGIY